LLTLAADSNLSSAARKQAKPKPQDRKLKAYPKTNIKRPARRKARRPFALAARTSSVDEEDSAQPREKESDLLGAEADGKAESKRRPTTKCEMNLAAGFFFSRLQCRHLSWMTRADCCSYRLRVRSRSRRRLGGGDT
jgi:hypothetical protein